ncbi:MAG TPA: alpha/beta fold hydrolase [Flavihumibacter sp.]
MQSDKAIPPANAVLFVPGAGHGAWCFEKIRPWLEASAIKVLTTDLPGCSDDPAQIQHITMEDEVHRVMEMARAIAEPLTLVGHSSGGAIISQAAEKLGRNKIEKLIYLDAFMPRTGESVISLAEKADQYNRSKGPVNYISLQAERFLFHDGRQIFRWNPALVEQLFYHDCTTEDLELAKKSLKWNHISSISTPVNLTEENFGAIPKYYILCTQARDLDKSSIANNLPAENIHRIASSHSPFLSMPEELGKILVEIVQVKPARTMMST